MYYQKWLFENENEAGFFFVVLNIFTIAFLFTVGYQNNSLTTLACSRAHLIPKLFQISVLKGETIKSLLKV